MLLTIYVSEMVELGLNIKLESDIAEAGKKWKTETSTENQSLQAEGGGIKRRERFLGRVPS